MLIVACTLQESVFALPLKYCSQARAVENQKFPDVEIMDIHYAQSCILTPCGFNFTRDGIAAMAVR